MLATGGDSALGGDDVDHAIAERLIPQTGHKGQLDFSQVRNLLLYSRELKEQLRIRERVDVELNLDVLNWQGILSREKFNALVDPLIDKAMKSCR